MILGYARVSGPEQNLERQLEALKGAKCQYIYEEKISGASTKNRTELRKMLANAQATDTIVVQKLDRLGRSLKDLLAIIDDLSKRNIEFVSLSEGFDTRTPAGKMVFSVIGAMAEFERNLIIDRVNDGIKNAKLKGTKSGVSFGRPKTFQTPERLAELKQLISDGVHVTEIARIFNARRQHVYRFMKKHDLTDIYQEIQAVYKSAVAQKKEDQQNQILTQEMLKSIQESQGGRVVKR